ncbi:cytochrome c [Roseibacterium beibuensis]|nr:cytochrome c [Roseibacterium beibuensis]MCS6622344.1 cytochrome c [Roseibacterium beibuensis]
MPEGLDLAQGEVLYGEYCASCHGANLEGQPDWQSLGPDGRLPAPPHDETGHTWHHPDSVLFQYTKLGGREALAFQGIEFDSGMPGFSGQLSDREIWTVLAYILSTWPERARAAQAARTDASLANEGS